MAECTIRVIALNPAVIIEEYKDTRYPTTTAYW
jgi:hypothetical protein